LLATMGERDASKLAPTIIPLGVAVNTLGDLYFLLARIFPTLGKCFLSQSAQSRNQRTLV